MILMILGRVPGVVDDELGNVICLARGELTDDIGTRMMAGDDADRASAAGPLSCPLLITVTYKHKIIDI